VNKEAIFSCLLFYHQEQSVNSVQNSLCCELLYLLAKKKALLFLKLNSYYKVVSDQKWVF